MLSVSADSRGRFVDTVCGPDKSNGHSAVDRVVPDELRFFDSPMDDLRDVSISELPRFGGITEG